MEKRIELERRGKAPHEVRTKVFFNHAFFNHAFRIHVSTYASKGGLFCLSRSCQP